MCKKKWLIIPATVVGLGLALAAYWVWGTPVIARWQAEQVMEASLESAELLKSHYAGVDCGSLKGIVLHGDLGVSQRSVCAGERAWFENDISFCDLVDNRDLCIGWMAIKIGDPAICQQISIRAGYFWVEDKLVAEQKDLAWLYDCYRAMANWRNDSSLCDLIPFSEDFWKQWCRETAENWEPSYLDLEESPI